MNSKPAAQAEAVPTVVFIDHGLWECHAALSGALRQRGVRTIRITRPPGGVGSQVVEALNRMLFDRTIHGLRVDERGAYQLVPELLADLPPEIVDYQAPEDLVSNAGQVLGPAAGPAARVGPGIPPEVILDKWELYRFAESLGIPQPRTIDSPHWTEFPVVVKARVGFGGAQVGMAADQAELSALWERISQSSGAAPIVQQRMVETGLMTGGVADHGRVLVSCSYVGVREPENPSGPAVLVQPAPHPEVDGITAHLIGALGFTGFFNIDWVADDSGAPHLIDFNARNFGSWPALQALGWDFLGAYLNTVGLNAGGPASPGETADSGHAEGVLLFPFPGPRSVPAVRRWVARSGKVIRGRAPLLGVQWAWASRAKVSIESMRVLAEKG